MDEINAVKEFIEIAMRDIASTQLSLAQIQKTLSPRDAWAIGELSNIWLTLFKIHQNYGTEETNSI